MKNKFIVAGLACGVCVLALSAAAHAKSYEVPAGSLKSALDTYVRQSGKPILFRADQVGKARSPGANGELSDEAALRAIVAGTSFRIQADRSGAVAVVPAARGAARQGGVSAAGEMTAGSAPADNQSADIVVTASKREQKLRDVPSAITVLKGEFLQQQGINSIRDYASLTPGLLLRDQGNPGVGTVIIRGLSTGSGSQSATSVVYFDEIPFGNNSYVAPSPEMADVESIEVLKGPQGTLYGASSLGGVVRIISKKPDPSRFTGSVQVEGSKVDGGSSGYMARAVVNIPLVTDELAVRASAFYRRSPGFADNVGTGTKNVNDGTGKGGRLAIGWTPNEDLRIDITGQVQDIKGNGYAYQQNVHGTVIPLLGKRKYTMFFDAGSQVKYKTASATVDYKTGIGTLLATASYNDSFSYFDRDTTPAFGGLLPLFGYAPGTAVSLPTNIRLKKTTGEMRFVSDRMGAIEFLAGVYATRETKDGKVHVNAFDAATMTPVPGDAFLLLKADQVGTYKELAAFGNATVYLNDRLDVTGGLRYAKIKIFTGSIDGGLLYGTPSLPQENTYFSDGVFTYLATLRWRPTDKISAFVRAASGFRPGRAQDNPNPPPGSQAIIMPDTVWNYEAGVKGSAIDGMLNFEASVYHIDWKNVQLTGVFNGLVLGANAGKAKVDGVEAQASLRPTRYLTLGGAFGYADARLSSISPQATASVGARAGDPLPLNPKWTGSFIVDQRIPLSDDLEGELGATLRYEAKKFTAYPGSTPDVNVRLPSITTLDLRAGLRRGGYHVQARIENLFDRNGVINSLTTGATQPSNGTIIRPRTFTIALSADF